MGKVNYWEAAVRHYHDGKVLLSSQPVPREANADQLFGLAAECALKAILVWLGVPTDADGGVTEPGVKKHIDALWPEYVNHPDGRVAARYQVGAQNPFHDWSVHHRYLADVHAGGSAAAAHERAAFACLLAAQKALADHGGGSL